MILNQIYHSILVSFLTYLTVEIGQYPHLRPTVPALRVAYVAHPIPLQTWLYAHVALSSNHSCRSRHGLLYIGHFLPNSVKNTGHCCLDLHSPKENDKSLSVSYLTFVQFIPNVLLDLRPSGCKDNISKACTRAQLFLPELMLRACRHWCKRKR